MNLDYNDTVNYVKSRASRSATAVPRAAIISVHGGGLEAPVEGEVGGRINGVASGERGAQSRVGFEG